MASTCDHLKKLAKDTSNQKTLRNKTRKAVQPACTWIVNRRLAEQKLKGLHHMLPPETLNLCSVIYDLQDTRKILLFVYSANISKTD